MLRRERDREIYQHLGVGRDSDTNFSTNINHQHETYHRHGGYGTKPTHSYSPRGQLINYYDGEKSSTQNTRRDQSHSQRKEFHLRSLDHRYRHDHHHDINSATDGNFHGSDDYHGLNSLVHSNHEHCARRHVYITTEGSRSQQNLRDPQHSQHLSQHSQRGQHYQYDQHSQHDQYTRYDQHSEHDQLPQYDRHSQYNQHSSGIRRLVQTRDNQKYHQVLQVVAKKSENAKKIRLDQSSQCSTTAKRATQASDDQRYLRIPQQSLCSQQSQCSTTITRAEQVRDGQRHISTSPAVPKQSKIIGKSVEEYLPYPAEGVLAVYTNDPVRAEAWLRNHVTDVSALAVGFDIEWKPQFKKKKHGGVENKTAVLQLAVEEHCLVLHLCHMSSFPKSLAVVLANKAILKVGSGILQDAVKLRKDHRLSCEGRADTQVLAKACGINTVGLGLKSLSKALLNIELNKPKRVSMSNWEQFPLVLQQIRYAALDAWIGLKIFLHLKSKLEEIKVKSTVPCDLGEPKERQLLICEVCGKKCKGGNEALEKHIEKRHTKCENCGKIFHSNVSKKHKKKCTV